MIASIQGRLEAAAPLRAVVEVNGFGYEVHIPLTTAEKLPAVGGTVKLHTFVAYREDSQTLYGFSTAADRDFFRLMIENVTGIGPKVAIGIMSRLSVALLEGAIRSGDTGSLSKCPGIGKKMAERLVLELKAKVGAGAAAGEVPAMGPGFSAGPHADAVAALMALGYKAPDADQAVRRAAQALGGTPTTEALVKKALA